LLPHASCNSLYTNLYTFKVSVLLLLLLVFEIQVV